MPDSTLDPANLTGAELDGRYQVGKRVGAGGSAFVYEARDQSSGDQVAIKVLLPDLLKDQVAMERLRREASMGAQLEHPNLCHIMGIGKAPGFEFVVMPFVDGELLIDRVWRDKALPLDAAARLVADMAEGLHFAHQKGIIHRDLKPENIMIVRDGDGSERAVVMDFGLAIARDLGADSARLTRTGLVVGTPEFMSPEQMCGMPVDPSSDVYSLAFMTYELLTGQLPFDFKGQHQLMVARLKGVAIPIRERRPDLQLPESLEQVLAKALRKEPAERYRSMPEFADAFVRAARGEQVEVVIEAVPSNAAAAPPQPPSSSRGEPPGKKRGLFGLFGKK
jgi:eukaryotic-like serine/threonine-protein kinase